MILLSSYPIEEKYPRILYKSSTFTLWTGWYRFLQLSKAQLR